MKQKISICFIHNLPLPSSTLTLFVINRVLLTDEKGKSLVLI